MPKVAKNKFLCGTLIVLMVLLSSFSFCYVNWSYLVSCSRALEEVRIGIFQEKGLSCYGTTEVDESYYAGITVYLKTLDEDGDWVTVTAWQNQRIDIVAVSEEYPVDAGTYKLELTHKAYLPNDLDTPVEIHYSETNEVVVN